MMIRFVPRGTVASAAIFSVVLVSPGFGENDAVIPAGKGDAVNVTFPASPPTPFTVMTDVAVPPGCILRLFGEEESQNPLD
jgi:hypothetical protein